MTRLIPTLILLVLASCSGTPDGGDAAMTDGAVPLDAGPRDGAAPLDARDGDSDGDGVPDAVDCEPSDAAIGRSNSRACATVCGDGVELCANGIYADCTASTDCACDTDGERRIVECGLCGMVSEECAAGRWGAISACLGQGECTFGDVEDRMTPRCGHDQRLCDAMCQWSEWTVLTPEGECEAGMRGVCISPFSDYLCTADCRREDDPDCNVT